MRYDYFVKGISEFASSRLRRYSQADDRNPLSSTHGQQDTRKPLAEEPINRLPSSRSHLVSAKYKPALLIIFRLWFEYPQFSPGNNKCTLQWRSCGV